MRVKVFPAIVMVPTLWAPGLLAVYEYPTIPLSVPVLPEVTLIQAALLFAVQEQPLPDGVTVTLPVPLDSPTAADAGEMA